MIGARALRSIGLAARRAAPAVASSKPAVPAFSFAANRALSTKEEAPSSGPPQTYADYSHDALLMLSVAGGAPAPAGRATPFLGAGKGTRRARAGDDDAVVERMVRDIMLVDGVSHADANVKMAEIARRAASGSRRAPSRTPSVP